MKCVVLTSEYPPSKGGVGNAALTFARAMAARGWSFAIATGEVRGVPALEVTREGTVRRFTLAGDASLWSPLSGEMAGLRSWITEQEPDVVVIHGWQGWCVRMVPWLRKAGIPVILQSHGFGFHRMSWKLRPPFGLKVWFGYQPFVWRLPSFIRSLAALSVLSKNPRYLTAFDHWVGVKSGCPNVVNIPNGVEQVEGGAGEFFTACPGAQDKFVVLCVANYCDRKNQLRALEVARKSASDRLFFVFIGGEENEYSRMLLARARQWGIEDKVAVMHGLSRALTESAILACDTALMTSKWEMQPLFLLEAMSAGKPWISTDVGSVRELRGGIVSAPDVATLTRNLGRLAGNESLRLELAEEGFRQWQSEYRPSVVYDHWDKLMHSVVKANREGS